MFHSFRKGLTWMEYLMILDVTNLCKADVTREVGPMTRRLVCQEWFGGTSFSSSDQCLFFPRRSVDTTVLGSFTGRIPPGLPGISPHKQASVCSVAVASFIKLQSAVREVRPHLLNPSVQL